MASSAEEVRKSIKTYMFVFGALAVLTVVTVLASYLHIGVVGGIFLALVIASAKGTLVASFFMHLLHERSTLFWILGVSPLFLKTHILIPVLQGSETRHLIDPVYKMTGETPPTPAPAAHHAGGHDGHDHGPGEGGDHGATTEEDDGH